MAKVEFDEYELFHLCAIMDLYIKSYAHSVKSEEAQQDAVQLRDKITKADKERWEVVDLADLRSKYPPVDDGPGFVAGYNPWEDDE